MNASFFKQLNDSDWKGCITEVGVGVQFLHDMLSIPGASKTLLWAEIPYAKSHQNYLGRSVSLDVADHMAAKMLRETWRDRSSFDRFGLAFSGTHKSSGSGQTHGWIALKTRTKSAEECSWNAHFSLPGYLCREDAAKRVSSTIQWFLNSTLLNYMWSDVTLPNDVRLDVLNGPNVTIMSQLLRLSKDNPIYFHKGQTRRAVDVIRKTERIYAGSFNPPTIAHMAMGGPRTLYLLGVDNLRKGRIGLGDLEHRITMVNDVLQQPLLVTCDAPKFIDMHQMLQSLGLPNGADYVQGTDTFNRMIADDDPAAFAHMQDVRFLVHSRDGEQVDWNAKSVRAVHHEILETSYPGSSSDVRNGRLEFVDPRIAAYIKENGLYTCLSTSTT